jgi:glycosyltransferase involved in cell wall biosynthesis
MDKICFVSLAAHGAFVRDSPTWPSGAGMQVRHLASRLAESGDFEIHVILSDHGQPDIEEVNQLLLHRLPQPPPGSTAYSKTRRTLASGYSLYKLLKSLDYQVCFTRGLGPEPGIVTHTVVPGKSRHIHMIANDRELKLPWTRGGGLANMIYRHGLKHASSLIYQYGKQEQMAPDWHCKGRHVIYSMYPFPEHEPSRGKQVLWVGRCRSAKQPQKFVELAGKLPGMHFTMIASGTEYEPGLMKKLEDSTRSLNNLHLIRGLPFDEVISWYPRSSILVNTSSIEGMPNTFLEAAAHGCCLVSLEVNPDGIFDEGQAGICAEGSLEKLVSVIRILQDNPDKRHDLAVSTYRFLRNRHDREKIIPRYLEILSREPSGSGMK